MAVTFDKAFERLIGHEGGFSRDRNDAGNWTGGIVGKGELKGTKYGIAANTYGHLDIENITLQQAKDIYKRDWWDKCGAHALHSAIVFQVWDFGINAGLKRAVIALQRAAGVHDDGILGPKTLQAVSQFEPQIIIFKFNSERLSYYTSLGKWSLYGKGWTNRVATNLMYAALDI